MGTESKALWDWNIYAIWKIQNPLLKKIAKSVPCFPPYRRIIKVRDMVLLQKSQTLHLWREFEEKQRALLLHHFQWLIAQSSDLSGWSGVVEMPPSTYQVATHSFNFIHIRGVFNLILHWQSALPFKSKSCTSTPPLQSFLPQHWFYSFLWIFPTLSLVSPPSPTQPHFLIMVMVCEFGPEP